MRASFKEDAAMQNRPDRVEDLLTVLLLLVTALMFVVTLAGLHLFRG